MSAHLGPAYDLVYDVLTGDRTPTEAVAILRKRGYLASVDGLDEAVGALAVRDGLVAGSLDPLVYLEVQPRPGANWRDVAIAKAEENLGFALGELGHRLEVVAS